MIYLYSQNTPSSVCSYSFLLIHILSRVFLLSVFYKFDIQKLLWNPTFNHS